MLDARNLSRYNRYMDTTTRNLSHDDNSPAARAERHRIRKLLLKPTGVKQWVSEANDALNTLMAGQPDHVIASVIVEVKQPGSEIQTMVQAALDRRELPTVLASQIFGIVRERYRVEHDAQPHCSHCGHASAQHSTVVDAWCYECRGACRYTQGNE